MNFDNFTKDSYFDLCAFRIKVTKYIMDEYDIPNLKTMTTTPQRINNINNIMINGYNENRGVQNTANLLADFIKNFCIEEKHEP